MELEKQPDLPRHAREGASMPAPSAEDASKATLPAPAIVASAFGQLDLNRRARVLGRLLGSVGPLALAVIGGGVFAKFLPNARLPVIPVSFEDAALATSSQVYELVRYVEQSNPNLVDGLMTMISQDGMVLTALGASIAAIAIRQISDRKGPGAGSSAG